MLKRLFIQLSPVPFQYRVLCPLCGYEALANSFWITEQIELAKEQAKEQVIKYLRVALTGGYSHFVTVPIPAL